MIVSGWGTLHRGLMLRTCHIVIAVRLPEELCQVCAVNLQACRLVQQCS